MIQATKPTLSFGVLLLIAIGLVGAVYYLSQQMKGQDLILLPLGPNQKNLVNMPQTEKEARVVSTENWIEYIDEDLAVSFKHPEKWRVRTYVREDFDIIVLTPDKGKDKIRIYVSNNEYVGMAGLDTKPLVVGGQKGMTAGNMVVAVKEGPNYFTFDAGQDQALLPEFDGIIKTVAFK